MKMGFTIKTLVKRVRRNGSTDPSIQNPHQVEIIAAKSGYREDLGKHFKSSTETKDGYIPKEGYRKDLDKNFRSRMESNVYRYLIWCHPDLKLVEYEPHLFTGSDGLPRGFKYLPDFRCTTHENNQYWVEVMYELDTRHKSKLDVMRRYRPDISITVVDSKVYQQIKARYSKNIPNWES
jgi:hypothetical protein